MKKKILTGPVCVMLSSEIYQKIKEFTDQQEISLSDYIREAIENSSIHYKVSRTMKSQLQKKEHNHDNRKFKRNDPT
jgi:SLT domain-containing protein